MIIWRGMLLGLVVSVSACISDERRVAADVDGDSVGDVAPDGTAPDAEVTSEVEPADTEEEVGPDVPDTVDTNPLEETSEDTRPGDLADSEPVDTAVDSAPNDTETEDTHEETRIEDIGDALDVLDVADLDVGPPPECLEANDCEGAANPCQVWTCVDQKCVGSVREGSCDDGNACTGIGTCVEGRCVPGPALTCDTTSPCARAICDPATGCGTEVVEGGFCEVPNGELWGACTSGRMNPPDVCSETGVCLDQTTPSATPLPKDLVLGNWYIAQLSILPASSGVVLGPIEFGVDGLWHFTTLRTGGAPLGPEVVTARGWCVDADGGLALDLAINHFIGQVDQAGEVFAASGKLGNEIMVGVRPTGTLSEMHGLYNVVMTTAEAGSYPVLWSGTIEFDHGCVVGGTSLHPQLTEADPIFLMESRSCLTIPAGGETRVGISIESLEGVEDLLALRGAIGPRGEVALFARDKDETSLEFGMLVLVRAHTGMAAAFSGTTSWVTPFQERFSNADGASGYRGFAGLLAFEDTTLVNGRFNGAMVTGKRAVHDAYGRFALELEGPSGLRMFSGYVSANGRLGVYHATTARLGWDDISDVSEVPTGPAWGVLVRRP